MKYGTQDFSPIAGDVVVVEDDPILGVLLQEIMVEAGAECKLFSSADDALIHLLSAPTPCSLLVTDYLLPGQLNGVDLAAMVTQKWPTVPVVLTTGYTLDHTPLPPGVVWLQKPWAVPTLMASIEIAMGVHSKREPLRADS